VLKFLRRLAGHVVRGLVMIWVVTTFTFVLVRLMPGDPVETQYETLLSKGMSPDQAKAQVAVTYGFVPHGSVWSQYGHYLWQLLHFDLGKSVRAQGVSVTTEVLSSAKWTIGLVLAGTFAVLATLPLTAPKPKNTAATADPSRKVASVPRRPHFSISQAEAA